MPTREECICCHGLRAVNDKRLEKGVHCITDSTGFQANCLDLDVLETSYYEFREVHGPPEENQPIHK